MLKSKTTFKFSSLFSVFGGIILTALILLCMIPVALLRSRLKKRHRELTEPLGKKKA